MKTLHLLPLLTALPLSGCPGQDDKPGDDSGGPQYWCESLDDVNTYSIEDGGGNASSGVVEGRIITSYGDDIHNPTLVGRLEYTLRSVTSGGAAQYEETDDYGDFAATLGQGTWRVQASTSVGGKPCTADYTFEVVAQKTTLVCVELACE